MIKFIIRFIIYPILGLCAVVSLSVLFFYFSKQEVIDEPREIYPEGKILVKPSFAPKPYLEYNVARGDRLDVILKDFGMSLGDILNNKKLFRKYDLYQLNYQQEIGFFYDIRGDAEELTKVIINKKDGFYVIEKKANSWEVTPIKKDEVILEKKFVKIKISDFLQEKYQRLKIPTFVISQLRGLYLNNFELKENFSKGRELVIGYNQVFDKNRQKISDDDIFYLRLETINGDDYEVFGYKIKDNLYFLNSKGESFERLLDLKPVDNPSRLTSTFGMRKHPILNVYRLHGGIDYGAVTGTKVFAAGDGIVVRKGPYGGYGNYLRIQHQTGLDTAYGHLSRYASKLREGSKVRKGEVVAYVGNTGLSLGSHLHFEVLKRGRPVNPLKLTLPPRVKLTDKNLSEFKAFVLDVKKEKRKAFSIKDDNDTIFDVIYNFVVG